MDTYQFTRTAPNRWRWWCRLRNHWRNGAHSVIEVFDDKFQINQTFCEFCGGEIKYDL